MADKTPADGVLSGFLIPWAFSGTYANDHTREVQYTEGNRRPVSPTIPSGQGLILEPSGDAESGAPASYFVRFPRGGVARPDGARPVYSATSGGTFTGCDRPTAIRDWQQVSTLEGRDMSLKRLRDGSLIATYWIDVGSTYNFKSRTRSTAGVWSASVTVASTADITTGYAGVCVVVPDDENPLCIYGIRESKSGAYKAYLAVSRSTDDGASWTVQTKNAIDAEMLGTDVRRMEAVSINGTIALFVEYDVSGTPKIEQYISTDGGIKFSLVAPALDAFHLGAVVVSGRYILVSTIDNGASDALVIRRCGSASVSAWDDSGVNLGAVIDGDDHMGAAAVVEPGGRIWHFHHSGVNHRTEAVFSDDYGVSWSSNAVAGFAIYQGASVGLSEMSAVWLDDRVVMIHGLADTSGSTPAPRTAGIHELSIGGRADVTVTQQTPGWGIPWSSAPFPEAGKSWAPIELLNTGWGTNTGAGAAWALGADGATISASSGNTGTNNSGAIGDFSTATGGAVFYAVVEENSAHGDGYLSLHFSIADDPSTTKGTTYSLYISSTHYFWTGGSPGPTWSTTHGFSGKIACLAALDLTNQRAYAWIADAETPGAPLVYTALGLKTDTTIPGAAIGDHARLIVASTGASGGSDSDFHFLGVAASKGVIPDLAGGFTNPADLDGISLSTTTASLLDKGIRVRSTGGVAYASTDEYEIPIKGQMPKEHTLPSVSPSPYRGWRSSGTAAAPLSTAQELRYTFDTDNAAAMRCGSEVFGIYLGGLYGVGSVVVKDNGVTVGTVTLTQTFNATRVGNSVYPVESGANGQGVYVQHGEYQDTMMELGGSGPRRKIVQNTAGTLQEGATVDTRRAVFTLEGVDSGDATAFSAKIHPREALILVYGRTTWQRLDLVLEAADPVPPEGFREIGVVCAGPVAVCGFKNDRASNAEWSDGVEVFTERDGSRQTTAWAKTRRMLEVSWVSSHRDVTGIRNASTTAPDYVLTATGGKPSALKDGVTLLLPEVYRAINGKAQPVVWIPYIPKVGSVPTVGVLKIGRASGAVYGRIMSPIRQERAGNVGVVQVSDAYSVSTVTIEEEL